MDFEIAKSAKKAPKFSTGWHLLRSEEPKIEDSTCAVLCFCPRHCGFEPSPVTLRVAELCSHTPAQR